MATPTEGNLNATTPAAPSGSANVEFQASAPYPDPNNPSALLRDISANFPTLKRFVCPVNGSLQDFTLPKIPAGVIILVWNAGVVEPDGGAQSYTLTGAAIHTAFVGAADDKLIAYFF